MRKFVYKVYLSRQEIITLLKSKNEIDELTCTFNDDETVIKISEYGSNRKYYFQVQELNGFSLLKLEQVSIIGMQSWVPFKLNPFLVEKLNAEKAKLEKQLEYVKKKRPKLTNNSRRRENAVMLDGLLEWTQKYKNSHDCIRTYGY